MDSSQIGVQGSVLGPLAFEVFINDLDDCANLKAVINKFADVTKFNVNKCKVMHIGRKNEQYEYKFEWSSID